ncbi:hypothetical protein ACLIYP_09865 [Streptomyces nanhaiensis]|uniref:hypothetical protein n=1 Tax=Streptomyces nanhaiensis TaxID=679319 RepID=UPI00399CC2FD
MSDAYIAWYRTRTTESGFLALADEFQRSGISIRHPNLGTGILLNADGDQVRMSVERIAELVGLAVACLNVEWWLTADVDVTCRFTYEPLGGECQTYYLDGLSADEVACVEEVILRQVSRQPELTDALIVDRSGASAEVDWDEQVLGGPTELTVSPDLMILPHARIREIGGVLQRGRVEEYDSRLSIYRKR